jgi:hypothetical protein
MRKLNTPSLKKTRIDLIFIFLLIIGGILRLYGLDRTLGTTGIGGFDEGVDFRQYIYTSFEFIYKTYYIPGVLPGLSHHVFNTFINRAMVVLFGEENEIALRFPVFLFGMGTLVLNYFAALIWFKSKTIARTSLLLTALCPIHIAYSQTIRGYSLIIFFTILISISCVKLLENPKSLKWTSIFVLTGTISLYTIPTNVYFIFGLAAWVALIFAFKKNREEFKISEAEKFKRFGLLTTLFITVGVLTILLYFPVLDQFHQASQGHQAHLESNYAINSIFFLIINVMNDSIFYIFQGPMKWFSPFLIIGIIYAKPVKSSLKWLPILVFFLPFLIQSITKVVGYPRVFIYNLPFFMIFTAAGMFYVFNILKNNFNFKWQWGIPGLYAVATLYILCFQYYPSLKTYDGKIYQKEIHKNSKPNDLILVTDAPFLYARKIYKQNLENIILENQLSGIKAITTDKTILDQYLLDNGKTGFPIFDSIFSTPRLSGRTLTKGKYLINIGASDGKSLLPVEFETTSEWKNLRGSGITKIDSSRSLDGMNSLFLKANSKDSLIVKTKLPNKIVIRKNSFVLLLWGGHNLKGFNGDNSLLAPALTLSIDHLQGMTIVPPIGWVNRGIGAINIADRLNPSSFFDWQLGAMLGKLPPGNYNGELILKVLPEHEVLYDSMRLFIIEAI